MLSFSLVRHSSPVAAALLLMLQLSSVDSKRIVFIPMPQMSHVQSQVNLATELSKLGHETWVCVPGAMLEDNSMISPLVRLIRYGNEIEDMQHSIIKSQILENFWEGKGQDVFVVYQIGLIVLKNSLDALSDVRFWKGIQNANPDLVVLDWVPFCRSMLAVPYKLGVPFAFFGTYHDVVNARVPHTSACNPEIMSDINDRMTFMERVQNTLLHFAFMTYNPFCDDSILQKLVPEKPPMSVSRLSAKAEIFIAGTDHILDYPRPTVPNTKLVGGTAAKPSKPLEGAFKEFMDESSIGAIIVSFGSSVINIPQEISEKMTIAFKLLNFNVVWRVNLTTPDPSRIMTSLWIPQNDLLGHKNTRMFVSHCGNNGQYESLYHGVPILCLPLFADQFYNARRAVNKGFGLRADIRQISAQELASLIRDIAHNGTYRSSIQNASKIFRQLFKNPQKKAAFWLDHVLNFGGSYMRYAGQEMPMYQYLLLDVFSGIFIALLVVVLFFLILVALVYRFFFCLFCGWNHKVKNQ